VSKPVSKEAARTVPPETHSNPARAVPNVLVELDTGTWVVERGVEHRRWRVKVGGTWCDADRAPNANVQSGADEAGVDAHELLVRPPGCQYLRRCRLSLPVGSEVELFVTRPREHAVPPGADLLSWLKYTKPARKTTVQRYRVGRTGRLVAESVWQKMRQRAGSRPG
jgi:hypothetical protein